MNNKYFIKQWLIALCIIIPITSLLVLGAIREPTIRPTILFAVGIGIAMLIGQRIYLNGKVQKLFLSQTPQKFIQYYYSVQTRSPGIPDQDAQFAYLKALSHCYYGSFESATDVLTQIDWAKRVPYIQTLELLIQALTCYLEKTDPQKGLELSLSAQRKGEASQAIPGMAQVKALHETYVQIGELQCANLRQDFIVSLEGKYKKGKLYEKLLIAWCLAGVYDKIGESEKAAKMHEYIKKTAPYCRPLLEPFFA